ncbi:MAG TPA: hypothetical protein VI795_03040 [Patescibacteria group bacterium]|nr:hypothetical protein [Patescibacteria group bacterium]
MKYFILFIFSLSIFLFHAIYTKHAIYGDGNGYYVTAQSILYDKTINSKEIINHLKNFQGRDYIFSRVFWREDINPYSIGASLFWIPSLLVASVFSFNRFDLLHEIFVGITGILLMISGLYFLEKYLLNFFKKGVVLIVILTIFFGSYVLYYSSFEPALSHQPAFFLISYLLYWTHKFKHTNKNMFLLGLISGLLPITRIADSVLLIPIIANLRLNFKKLIIVGLGFTISLLPQLYMQYYFYGTIFKNSYVTENISLWSFNLFHIVEYLFSLKRGLFIWSPICLLGIYGLIKLKRNVIVYSIFLLWLIGSFWSAYLSAGFGQRLSFATMPFFALGIAKIYSDLKFKHQIIYSLFFILWNVFLLIGFYLLEWKNVP